MEERTKEEILKDIERNQQLAILDSATGAINRISDIVKEIKKGGDIYKALSEYETVINDMSMISEEFNEIRREEVKEADTKLKFEILTGEEFKDEN